MARSRRVAAAASVFWMLGASAEACVIMIEPKLADARTADAIAVGDVADYEIEAGGDRLPGGARITLDVDDAISGSLPSTVTIFWPRGLNNGPPGHLRGGFLFVLRKPAPAEAAHGADYFVTSDVCTPALVFRRGSAPANAIREMFGLYAEPLETPPRTVQDMISAIPWPAALAYGLIALGVGLIGLVALWPRSTVRPGKESSAAPPSSRRADRR